MFDRFGVGSPSPFGIRGGALAAMVHATILAGALGAAHTSRGAAGPVVVPESILVFPQAPRHGIQAILPVVPVAGPGDIRLPAIPSPSPSLPSGVHEPWLIEAPVGPVGGIPTGDPNGVYDSNVVEQAPELLASPPPRYPEMLRLAHIEGAVIVEGVVDTLGRMERKTLRVIASPHPALSASALECLAGAIFRPGRVEGRAVRVLVQVPVQFAIAKR